MRSSREEPVNWAVIDEPQQACTGSNIQNSLITNRHSITANCYSITTSRHGVTANRRSITTNYHSITANRHSVSYSFLEGFVTGRVVQHSVMPSIHQVAVEVI